MATVDGQRGYTVVSQWASQDDFLDVVAADYAAVHRRRSLLSWTTRQQMPAVSVAGSHLALAG